MILERARLHETDILPRFDSAFRKYERNCSMTRNIAGNCCNVLCLCPGRLPV